ncbi:MAG: outer membrane protein assembly factor BamA [Deltaproteobacteria bacterium]|nr:outer membrane protein assembly factor BamA [Deltaproteobacteria bacterium]
MGEFIKRNGAAMNQTDGNKTDLRGKKKMMATFIGLLCLFVFFSGNAMGEDKIAVLPFRIHSLKPMDDFVRGLQEMFTARLAGKSLEVIDIDTVNQHPMAFLPLFEPDDLSNIGKDLQVDWLILGSLTQVGEKISIDLKITDINGVKPPFSVFMVEDDIDKIADASERAATSIYNRIAEVEQIDSIRIEGNRRVESDAIMAVIDSKKGQSLDQGQLDKDLREIYGMGFFTDVNIEIEEGTSGKVIIFNVTEKPSITNISFEGNKKLKEDELKEELGIKRYSILNQNEIKQSVNRLRELYQSKGYYNAKIEDKITELSNNEVALIYSIQEGEKIYITDIDFVGNEKFDDGKLKDVMETSEKGMLSFFTNSGMLDMKKLEFDIQKVLAYYHNHGFIKAKAGDPKVDIEEGKGISITIEIIEGPPYSVNEVNIEGDLIAASEDLLSRISIIREKVFNREVLREDVLFLKDLYSSEGYAYAEVIPLVDEDDERHLVNITYKISKGLRVRLERINIAGNSNTRDIVIRRELPLIEGEFFSGEGLRKGMRNLHRLGFFEDVQIQTKKGTLEDLMIMDINVKERATGMFSMGVGYSSFDKTVGTLSISQNNFLGRAQKLSAEARLGSRTTEFDVKFTEPWIFGKHISMDIAAFKWETEYDEYTKDSTGGALGAGFPLKIDEYTEAHIKYIYDNAEITIPESDLSEVSTIIQDMEGDNLTSSMTFVLRRDSKDRPWLTTKGSLNSITFQYAGGPLGGDSYFNKYEARSAWYFPLWKDTVFVIQARAGYIKRRAGGTLPVYEKYTLGGINSVRGYDYASISPRDPKTDDKIGGEKMWVYNLEYRFPLLKEQGIVGIVFCDAGNVFTEEEDFKFEARRSIGTGIRWYSPVGPIRVEYGYKLDKFKDDDSSGNYEFTVGGIF